MSLYSLWLLERPPFSFPLLSTPSSHDAAQQFQKYYSLGRFGVPSREDWTNIWSVCDLGLRRKAYDPPSHTFPTKAYRSETHILFHLGHIPTHLDIHLSNSLKEANTEPTEFKASYGRQ